MFERYTEEARRAIFFAHQEASCRNSLTIDTAHILLGLCHDRRNIANRWFALRKKQALFEKIICPSTSASPSKPGTLPLTLESKQCLAYASAVADQHKHHWIDTSHILAGLMRDIRISETLLQVSITPVMVDERLSQIPPYADWPWYKKFPYRYNSFCGSLSLGQRMLAAILFGLVMALILAKFLSQR